MQKEEAQARTSLARAKRVVVKIGSRLIAEQPETFSQIAADLAAVAAVKGRRVVLVSSGAIALGLSVLGMSRRPRGMDGLQAAAAAGQGELMHRWALAFRKHDRAVAQVLLSHADLANRQRVNNARAALTKLMALGAIPIVNENDAVATDEIRFGDNDELAAMVTPLVDGELLVLLSDVDGVLDDDGNTIGWARDPSQLQQWVRPNTSAVGRGGMDSKIEAARRATVAGASVVIASARHANVVQAILGGDSVGTLLSPKRRRLSGRKHWIAYTLRPTGVAIIDDGAANAIRADGRSVLSIGVVGVRGGFAVNDMISVVDRQGNEVARGLSRLSAVDAARLAGTRGEDAMLIHRDDLVLLS